MPNVERRWCLYGITNKKYLEKENSKGTKFLVGNLHRHQYLNDFWLFRRNVNIIYMHFIISVFMDHHPRQNTRLKRNYRVGPANSLHDWYGASGLFRNESKHLYLPATFLAFLQILKKKHNLHKDLFSWMTFW